jgi:hypothetical protein
LGGAQRRKTARKDRRRRKIKRKNSTKQLRS